MTNRYKKFIFEYDTTLFLRDKYAQKLQLQLYYKDGHIFVKPKKYIEIGTYDEITINDFLKTKSMQPNWVYYENINNKVIYKLEFDIEKLTEVSELKTHESITISEDLKYLITFIAHSDNNPIFYSIALTSYDDIPEKQLLKRYGKSYRSLDLDNFEFLILDINDLYPSQMNYKFIIK
jgi:hypothetical protein